MQTVEPTKETARTAPAILTPRDVAHKYDITQQTVYFNIWLGKLRAKKRDGQWFITESAVRDWLERTGRASA